MLEQLIIFGAGASYGSDTYNTPPLGALLFKELQKFNPNDWGRIDGGLAEIFANDFELGMTKISKTQPTFVSVLQRVMGLYFFQFHAHLNQSNLYIKLTERIAKKNWRGTMASLNYELLLEASLSYSNLQFSIGEPANQNQIELCYPHGCCHLFCSSVGARNASFPGLNVTTGGKIKRIVDPILYQEQITQDSFPPVMSYFEPRKRCTSGMNFIEAQRARFKTLILSAKNIALIGIRVRDHDKHIWDYLSKTNARLIYCAGERGAKEFNTWKQEERPVKNDLVLKGYFKDSFDIICANIDLI